MRQNLLADTTVGVVKFRNQASELSVQNRIAVGQAIDVGNKPRCCLGMGLGNLIGQSAKRSCLMVLCAPQKRIIFTVNLFLCLFLIAKQSFDTSCQSTLFLDIFLQLCR